MKVCLINNLYKPLTRGGAEKVLELIHEGFVLGNHDVFIICTRPWFLKKVIFSDNIYRLKSFYYNLGGVPVFFRVFWHFYDMFDIVTVIKIWSIFLRERPGLVITNNLKGLSFLTPLLLRVMRIRHIHILHDMQLIHPSGLLIYGKEVEVNAVLPRLYSSICRFLFGFSGGVVSPSQWLLDQHLSRGFFKNIKKLVIPNPVAVFENVELKNAKKNEVFQFLYVGQLESHKGINFLVNVFGSVNNAELVIVGDGSILPQIKLAIGKCQNITLVGRKTKSEVLEMMRHADCLIVPSLCYENSPTVIYEAMISGLPVIGSRIGGVTEFLHKIGGLLFAPGDDVDLKKKINYAIDNPREIVIIKNRYLKGISNYGVEVYVSKLLKYFFNV